MGMLPALLLGALSYGWVGMGGVLILYWIIQQSENNILVPAIMSQTL
jgi:predicted PurR-regulated permease PerM